jgi:hypothetical protein
MNNDYEINSYKYYLKTIKQCVITHAKLSSLPSEYKELFQFLKIDHNEKYYEILPGLKILIEDVTYICTSA